MADQPKRWIVLLNKVPRGPLTADQIRALIKEGLLRHNDVAFESTSPGSDPNQKKSSEWKLLWQFPEFDRRLEKDGTPKPEKPAWSGASTPPASDKGAPERRRQITPDEASLKTRDQLPTELLDIPPEDLLVHSTAQEAMELDAAVPDAPKSFDLNLPSRRAMVAAGLTFAAMLFAWTFWPVGGPARVAPKPPEPVAVIDSARRPPAGNRAPTARVTSRPSNTIARPKLPEARIPASGGRIDELPPADRGEIDEEDDRTRLEEAASDDEPPTTGKIRRPRGNKRSRVLTDERGEPDEGSDAPADEPPSEDE